MPTRSLEMSCRELAILLSHPHAGYLSGLNNVINSGVSKKSAKYVCAFRDAVADLSPFELQELYTRTFDLNPMCSPALSVHLFGVESFKRSHLMVGLLDIYRAAEYSATGILDHTATPTRGVRRRVSQHIIRPGRWQPVHDSLPA